MRLLLDENLSRRIVPFLQQAYPGSTQVALVNLEAQDDMAIWEFAKAYGHVIVTRDADFLDLSQLKGQPPQIIWLRTPNLSRGATLALLLNNQARIEAALLEARDSCVELLGYWA